MSNLSHTPNAWWTTAATSASANAVIYGITAVAAPSRDERGPLDWLREQISEVTELAAA